MILCTCSLKDPTLTCFTGTSNKILSRNKTPCTQFAVTLTSWHCILSFRSPRKKICLRHSITCSGASNASWQWSLIWIWNKARHNKAVLYVMLPTTNHGSDLSLKKFATKYVPFGVSINVNSEVSNSMTRSAPCRPMMGESQPTKPWFAKTKTMALLRRINSGDGSNKNGPH